MTNIATQIKKSKLQIESSKKSLEKARAILAKFNQPKMVPELFDWQMGESGCTVTYYLGETEKETFLPYERIYSFINGFYTNVVDRFENDEHVQYVDTQSAEDYFNENQSAVLIDFLKHETI